jgi:hypothetical protein
MIANRDTPGVPEWFTPAVQFGRQIVIAIGCLAFGATPIACQKNEKPLNASVQGPSKLLKNRSARPTR